MVRGDGPHKIKQRVGDNAYKVELPSDMHISPILILETSLPTLRMKMKT